MKYINDEKLKNEYCQVVNNLQDNLQTDSDIISILEAAIFSEQPYIAQKNTKKQQ